MPTHRSLSILAIALAQILVAANARFERGLYLLDAPENINPDDLYNEMVNQNSTKHLVNKFQLILFCLWLYRNMPIPVADI